MKDEAFPKVFVGLALLLLVKTLELDLNVLKKS
jgi:hypothetical protein